MSLHWPESVVLSIAVFEALRGFYFGFLDTSDHSHLKTHLRLP